MGVLIVLADIFELSQQRSTAVIESPTIFSKNTYVAVNMKILLSE